MQAAGQEDLGNQVAAQAETVASTTHAAQEGDGANLVRQGANLAGNEDIAVAGNALASGVEHTNETGNVVSGVIEGANHMTPVITKIGTSDPVQTQQLQKQT